MYCIRGVIYKAGGAPVFWAYYSAPLTQAQCEKMLSRKKEPGKAYGFRVTLTNFSCEKFSNTTGNTLKR